MCYTPYMEYPEQNTSAELADLLTRAAWRLRRREHNELAPFGLTHAQTRALRALVDAGAMRIGDLASLLEIVPRAATTRVDGLEEAGLVTRRMDPGDRRSILVAPTTQGLDLVARLAEERGASAETLFAPLPPEDRAELIRLLASLTEDSR
jgi:DNA-binding MarR family transcriptional regulator